MFTWFMKLLGLKNLEEDVAKAVDEAVKEEAVVEAVSATKPKPKKAAPKATKKGKKKGTGVCNFDKLTKDQLLKEAKHRGVKANASLSKAEILKRVKNAK